MRYWKYIPTGGISKSNIKDVNDLYEKSSENIEVTEAEYDAYILQTETLPRLAQENINHQMFQNAETGLRKEKQRYQNSLFTEAYIDIKAVADESTIPDADKESGYIRYLNDANKIKYDEFNAFLKEASDIDLRRAEEYFNLVVNGSTSDEALAKVEAIKISGVQALQGRNDFISWLQVEHPTLATYMSNTASLKYETFLTEDEPIVVINA